jgi:RNA polymerase sigma factor (sigma-70 family)
VNENLNVEDLAEAAFRDHYFELVRFLRRRTGSQERAEDLAQTVFADAVVGLQRFEPGKTPVLAWLYTVARRRLIDEARHRSRQAEHERAQADASAPTLVYGPELAKVLMRAIRDLPEEARRVVVMRLLEGRGFAEIARELSVSEAACKMRFTRALRLVRDRLVQEGITP